MESNTLVVTVAAARFLPEKSHGPVEYSITLTLVGKGTLRSKVQTEPVKAITDCEWNERCEFSLSDFNSRLDIVLHHKKGFLGTSDSLGRLSLTLDEIRALPATPQWFRLQCSKEKYHVEVLLAFQYCFKTRDLHPVAPAEPPTPKHSSSMLDTLKRKANIRRRVTERNRRGSTMSLAVTPEAGFTTPRPSMSLSSSVSAWDLTMSEPPRPPTEVPHSRTPSPPTLRSETRSALSFSRDDRRASMMSTSSGRGSLCRSVPNGDERSKEDLLGVIEKQRRELAMRDKRIDELEEYVDRLLARVLNTCPQILHVAGGAPKRRLRF